MPKASLEASRWLQHASQKKASILDPILKLFLSIFEAPGGRSVQMASKIASTTALALKLGLCTPGSSPGAHLDPLGPRFWNLRELIFEASFSPSQRPKKQARSPKKRWAQTARLVKGGRRCWRSHSQYNSLTCIRAMKI